MRLSMQRALGAALRPPHLEPTGDCCTVRPCAAGVWRHSLPSRRYSSEPADGDSLDEFFRKAEEAAGAAAEGNHRPGAGEAAGIGAAASPASAAADPDERRRALAEALREAQLAEAAMAKFFEAQRLLLRGRPDAAYFADAEARQLDAVQELMPRYRTRPSLLLAAAKVAGAGAGTIAAAAPRQLRDALVGGLQDALTESYNGGLAELRRRGLSDTAPEVRQLLLVLRDSERAPEGAPAPPDLLALGRTEALADVGVAGVVGAAAKAVALALLGVGRRL